MKRSRADILWMVLPVLLLLGIGWLLRSRGAATLTLENRGLPFRVRPAQVNFLPVSPREWYDGFDTKIEVQLEGEGAAPGWWGKDSGGYSWKDGGRLFDGQGKALRKAPTVWLPHRTAGVWHVIYLMKLSDLPVERGEIRLKDRQAVLDNNQRPVTAPFNINVVARPKGETVPVPVLERKSRVEFLKYEVTSGIPHQHTHPKRDSATIRIWYRRPKDLPDAQGHLKVVAPDGTVLSSQYGSSEVSGMDTVAYQPQAGEVRVWEETIDMSAYFSHPGELKAICTIYSGDEWPLKVPLPLRKADREVQDSARGEPKFAISEVKVRQPDADERRDYGASTVVAVQLTPRKVTEQDKALPWFVEPLWDECVRSDSGDVFVQDISGKSAFMEARSYPEMDLSDGAKPAKVFVDYYLNLNRIPANTSRLTFYGSVAMGGSRRVPFSVVVREERSRS